MPAYLSNGSRHYNRARRVSAQDPIGQLGYYLPSGSSNSTVSPSSTPSQSSQLSASSTRRTDRWAEQQRPHRMQPAASNRRHQHQEQNYGQHHLDMLGNPLDLARVLGLRRRTGQAPEIATGYSSGSPLHSSPKPGDVVKEKQQLPLTASGSPQESSGFSEGTQDRFSSVARQNSADKTGNILAGHPTKLASSKSRPLGAAIGQQRPELHEKLVPSQPIHQTDELFQAATGRRKVTRFNKRIMLNEADQMVNPYALSELFSQSEIPGFREIFASNSYLRKFCWVVAFLIMTVLSLNDMLELITEYFEHPITVDVRLRDSARLPFPSVTVCNLNVVRFSALCSSSISSHHDLASQMPSELREKLCGLLMEKKKNNGSAPDTEIADINNIGIGSTTPIASTGASTISASRATTSGVSSAFPFAPGLSSPSVSLSGDPNLAGGPFNPTTPLQSSAQPFTRFPGSSTGTGTGFSAPPVPMTTASPLTPVSQTQFPSTSTRRTTARGALDLGDFSQPALLLGSRMARSIRFTDTERAQSARPFASGTVQLRVRPPGNKQSNQVFAAQLHDSPTRNSLSKQPITNPPSVNVFNPNAGIRQPASPGSFSIPHNLLQPSPGILGLGSSLAPTTPMQPVISPSSTNPLSPTTMPEDFELTERQERELQENLTNWLAVMYNRDPKQTWLLGHQFDDMILRCTMKSVNCTHQRSFENTFTATEGNCFNYRSKSKRRSGKAGADGSQGGQASPFEEANLAGTNHGLELVLNLEKNEYLSGSSQVGALIMIHHPSDLNYEASEATFVAPEFTTYIGLKMVNITRLPAPYPELCVDSWPAKFADNLTKNSTYSQQACLKKCLQKTIQSHCQCQSAFMPIVELDSPAGSSENSGPTDNGVAPENSEESGTGNETETTHQQQRIIICDTRKQMIRQCVREVMFRAADRVHNCECPPKCQVVRYDKTISMARWPTQQDKVTFDRGKTDVNFQNLAKVIVYFQTMTCEEITQQAVFTAAKLFSALGGIMGMYVGFSVLSVFEIFEVMARKTWHHFRVKLVNRNSHTVNNLYA